MTKPEIIGQAGGQQNQQAAGADEATRDPSKVPDVRLALINTLDGPELIVARATLRLRR